MVDPIILGHNQFIGVNHFSQDAARNRIEKFSDIKNVFEIIDFCSRNNVNGMMLSTHPRSRDILEGIKDHGLAEKLNFYPLIPYAQGYVRKMNEKGIVGTLDDALRNAPLTKKINLISQGSLGILRKDFSKLFATLIDLELIPFRDLRIKAVFLHNTLTDLGLGLQTRDLFEFYIDYIQNNYGAFPAFGTMNLCKLVQSFKEWDFDVPLVMTSINKLGFQMNPSRESCEKCLSDYNIEVLAMSTLAAGYLKPSEAYPYVFSLPKIGSVVVGVSTKEHALETFDLIRKYQKLA